MIDIEEELKEIREEHEPHHDKRPSKIWLFVIGGFMALLMISFVFGQYPLFGIIFGQIQSSKLVGNAIESSSLRVVFTENTLSHAITSWEENPKVETVLCFSGYRVGSDIIITNGYTPEIYSQEFDHVNYEPCDSETILMFHTHPWKRCIASDTDISSLERRNKVNPDTAMIIMCEEGRFSMYE